MLIEKNSALKKIYIYIYIYKAISFNGVNSKQQNNHRRKIKYQKVFSYKLIKRVMRIIKIIIME